MSKYAVAAVLAFALSSIVSGADARSTENGQSLNGKNLNGKNLNGRNLNGRNLNGMSLEGRADGAQAGAESAPATLILKDGTVVTLK